MKKSSLIHGISIASGVLGALALVGAWLAGESGRIFGFSQLHCYYDAIILELISISAGICALYRRQLEEENQINIT